MNAGRKERKGRPGNRGLSAAVERRLVAIMAVVAFLVLAAGGFALDRNPVPTETVGVQGGGVTVINVPPQFSGFRISSQDGLNYIDVVVSDYNSWADIFRVELQVDSDLQTPVADVAFQQYPTNVSLQPQPQFTEPLGSFLVRDLSSATYDTQPITIPERTEMRVTFVMSPVNGKWLSITVTDLGGLTAFAQVEYGAGFVGQYPAVSGWILVPIAVAFTVLVVAARIRRDRRGE